MHTAAAVFQILCLYPQIQFQQLPLWVKIQQLNSPYQKLAQNQCQMCWLLSHSSNEHQLTTTKQTNKSQKYNNASSRPVNISKTFLNFNSLQTKKITIKSEQGWLQTIKNTLVMGNTLMVFSKFANINQIFHLFQPILLMGQHNLSLS